jgi:hypothetical protein
MLQVKVYGKLAFKSLGALGVGYGIYDAGVAFQEGKSVPEMAFRFVGVDPLYNTIKKYQRLPEDAQEIQKKINAQQSLLEQLYEKFLDLGLSPKDAADAARKEFEQRARKAGGGIAYLMGL